MNVTLKKVSWPWLLLALIVGVTALRVVSLWTSGIEIHFDEAQYWVWSKSLEWGYFSKPPLIGWLIRLATEICGDSEACIRSPAPILHGLTAAVLAVISWRLWKSRGMAILAGLLYLTMPAVAYSSTLMSTDVPLLFLYAASLGFVLEALRDQSQSGYPKVSRWFFMAGVLIGVGFYAKYAMIYFCVGLIGWMVQRCLQEKTTDMERTGMERFKGFVLPVIVTLCMAGLVLTPHILWNASSHWNTLRHTASNASWGQDLFNLMQMLEFLGSQIGIAGFVVIGFAGYGVWLVCQKNHDANLRQQTALGLMVWLTLPPLVIVSIQAFLSRALANWAAVAYVPACLLAAYGICSVWQNKTAKIAAKIGFALNVGISLAIVLFYLFTPFQILPRPLWRPFEKTLGYEGLVQDIDFIGLSQDLPLVMDDRELYGRVAYYGETLTRLPTLRAWRGEGAPKYHYELVNPLRDDERQDIYLLAKKGDAERVLSRYTDIKQIAELTRMPKGRNGSAPVDVRPEVFVVYELAKQIK